MDSPRSITVRKMEERDVSSVVEIECLSFTCPWREESFIKEIEENKLAHYFVAEIEGELAGYIGMWEIMDEGHITNIAVKPETRKKGVGKALLSKLIEYAKERELSALTLEVRVSNASAKSLYKSYGFESVGIRPKYYEDTKEDAEIMWKEFK